MLSSAYPVLSFSLSNLSWKGSGGREGKMEGRGRFLGESLGYELNSVLFEAFIPARCF